MDRLVAFACEKRGKTISLPEERCGHVEVCPECNGYIDVPRRDDPRCTLVPTAEQDPSLLNPRTPRQLWLEVCAVLFLSVVPALYGAVGALRLGTGWQFSTELPTVYSVGSGPSAWLTLSPTSSAESSVFSRRSTTTYGAHPPSRVGRSRTNESVRRRAGPESLLLARRLH